MMNTNNRELNMNELAIVTGGIRVKASDPIFHNENGIPRGGK